MIQLVGEEVYVQFNLAEFDVISAVEAALTPVHVVDVGVVKFTEAV